MDVLRSLALISLLFLFFGCLGPSIQPEPNLSNVSQPALPSCIDSDGGADASVKGTVTLASNVYEDRCEDNLSVHEYYCDANSVSVRVISCEEGQVCDDGACAAAPPPPPPPPQLCRDTDGGDDPSAAGTVTFENVTYSDTCQGANDLLEYYCENDALRQTTSNCGTGNKCENGACISLSRTCSESDASDESKAGTTTQYGGGVVMETKSDRCLADEKIEYYCEAGMLKNRTETCPADTYCYNGACLPDCEDFDSGKNYQTASYVTTRDATNSDYCENDQTLVEYYCSGDEALSIIRACGIACLDGRCYEPSDVSCTESGTAARLKSGTLTVKEEKDLCLDYQTARDYFCAANEIDYTNIRCDSDEVCHGARCHTITVPACYDLDDGVSEGEIYVASSVVTTTNSSVDDTREDSCFNDITVIEYQCDGTSFRSEYTTCPTDERCQDGACFYPYACMDSDGGQQLAPGYVTLKEGTAVVRTERDACTDNTHIHETFCDEDGRAAFAILPCPVGTTCDPVDGSCK